MLAKRQNVILVDTIEKLNEKIDIVSRSIQDAINIADAGSVAMDVAPELAREQEVLSLELSNLKKTLNAKEMEVLRREEAMEAFKTSQATAIDEKVCEIFPCYLYKLSSRIEESRNRKTTCRTFLVGGTTGRRGNGCCY